MRVWRWVAAAIAACCPVPAHAAMRVRDERDQRRAGGTKASPMVCLSIGLLSWAVAAAHGQPSLLWAPPSVEVSAYPGAQASFTCIVANEGGKELRFSVRAAEVREREEGSYETVEEPPSAFSCTRWIRVEPTQITLKPKEVRDIVGTVSVPRGTPAGGRYAAVVCELQPDEVPSPPGPVSEPQARVVVQWRMSTIVFLTVLGGPLDKRASIADIEVSPAQLRSQDALIISAPLENKGNIHVFATGRLVIRTKDGRRVREVPLGSGRGGILPGATVKFTSIIRRTFAPGEYVAEASFSYGGAAPAVAAVPFTVAKTVVAGATQAVSAAFSVEPQVLEAQLPPGSYRTWVLAVRNTGEEPLEVRAGPVDIACDEQGEPRAAETAGASRSCAPWLAVRPAEFTLRPGRTQQVRLAAATPGGQTGGRYGGIEFVARPAEQADGAAELSRVAAVLLTVGAAPAPQAQIEAVEVREPAGEGEAVVVLVELRNTGEVHLRPKAGTLLVKALPLARQVGGAEYQAAERELEKASLQPLGQLVLPGGTIVMEGRSAEVAGAGKYILEVAVDYGAESPTTMRKEFAVR